MTKYFVQSNIIWDKENRKRRTKKKVYEVCSLSNLGKKVIHRKMFKMLPPLDKRKATQDNIQLVKEIIIPEEKIVPHVYLKGIIIPEEKIVHLN